MKSKIKKLGFVSGALAVSSVLGVMLAQAALTLTATQMSSDGVLTLKGAAGSAIVIGDDAQTGQIDVASSSAALTLGLGNGVSAGTQVVNILSGTGTAGGGTLALGNNPRVTAVSLGNGSPSNALTISIGNAATATTTNVNILSGTGTAGGGTLALGNNPRVTTVSLGNGDPSNALTVSIGNGASATTTTVNIGSTAASSTVGINGGKVGAGTTITGALKQTGGRTTVNVSTSTAITVDTTATIAQILDNRVFEQMNTVGTGKTLTTPTAANIVAGLPGTAAIGDMISFVMANSSQSTTFYLAGGAGVTIRGSAIGTAASTTRAVFCMVDATGTAGVTCY